MHAGVCGIKVDFSFSILCKDGCRGVSVDGCMGVWVCVCVCEYVWVVSGV